jgi:hypothetical protein
VQRRARIEVGSVEADHPDIAAAWLQIADKAAALAKPPTRPGRRGNGIEHYLTWAARYAEKVNATPRERNPIAALAEEWEGSGVTRTYIRDTITDARRRYGLLTSSGQGCSGGELTEKALALIAERDKLTKEKP